MNAHGRALGESPISSTDDVTFEHAPRVTGDEAYVAALFSSLKTNFLT